MGELKSQLLVIDEEIERKGPILLYCSQSGSKGMIVSHLQAVVP
jgi:hypothetical protein